MLEGAINSVFAVLYHICWKCHRLHQNKDRCILKLKLSSILIFVHSWNSFIAYLCKCAGSADNSSALSNRTLTSAVMGDGWTPEQSFPILFRQDTADFLNADMGLLSVTRRDGITRKQSHIKIYTCTVQTFSLSHCNCCGLIQVLFISSKQEQCKVHCTSL